MNSLQLLEQSTAPVDTCQPVEGEPATIEQQTQTRRVMLVDDEQNILSALRRLLRGQPYDIVTHTCAADALKAMEDQPAQLVIADYRMPGMTGIEFLREIRRRWPNTVRIILSGYAEVSVLIAAVNEGEIYKFIAKPWNDEEIKLHIRRAIEQHELAAENRKMANEILEQNRQLIELNRKLDQRVSDARIGLSFAQELLETIDVAVLTIDDTGLVVGANRAMRGICADGHVEVVGVPVQTALPERLYRQVFKSNADGLQNGDGCIEFDDHVYQWRLRVLHDGNTCRGNILTLWEEVPCK